MRHFWRLQYLWVDNNRYYCISCHWLQRRDSKCYNRWKSSFFSFLTRRKEKSRMKENFTGWGLSKYAPSSSTLQRSPNRMSLTLIQRGTAKVCTIKCKQHFSKIPLKFSCVQYCARYLELFRNFKHFLLHLSQASVYEFARIAMVIILYRNYVTKYWYWAVEPS